MAIKSSFTDAWDEVSAEAHIKIDESVENWKTLSLTAKYWVYKNAAQAAAGKPPIAQGEVTISKADATTAEKLAGKAWRDALTQMVKTRIFQNGTIVSDSDPTEE